MSISSNSVRRTGAIAKKGSLSDVAQGVLSVIRGLINSRKRITTLKDVESEYKDLEGQAIPFAKCGFPSLMDLMRSSGDFHISKNGDEVLVSLKLSKNNEGVASQIQSKAKKPIAVSIR